jgi:NAD(P)-dependent dehydrogenase (short-subunit alcohol dehydrogenase family)
MDRLAGKVAVITGATAGIGRATAMRFGAEGATLLLCGRNRGRADALLAELRASGVSADFLLGDIRSEDFVAELADTVRNRHGRIDSMVLNAGVISVGKLWEITPEQYDDMMEVNVRAPWLCIRQMHGLLADGATVIVTGSVSSFAIFPGEGVYCMTKAAVIQMVRTLALELADRRIRVNALCPGVIGGGGMSQDGFDSTPDPVAEARAAAEITPLGRVGTLEEVANGALFLASDESSFMTGTSLLLDGGIIIPRV